MPNTKAVGVAYADPQFDSLYLSVSTVAATGSAQTDAAAVGTGFTLVTGADATKGVILPAAVSGNQECRRGERGPEGLSGLWGRDQCALGECVLQHGGKDFRHSCGV
jgi:hypothetical protein